MTAAVPAIPSWVRIPGAPAAAVAMGGGWHLKLMAEGKIDSVSLCYGRSMR